MLNISSETRPVNFYQNGKLTLLHHSYLLTLYFCALNNWCYWLIELFRCTLSTLEWEISSAIGRFCLIWGFAYLQNFAYWNKKWSNSQMKSKLEFGGLGIVSSYMLRSKPLLRSIMLQKFLISNKCCFSKYINAVLVIK